jgi:hypothetical protein
VVNANDGSHAFVGGRVHAVMEASAINALVNGGSRHAVDDVLSFPNGISVRVNSVDSSGTMLTGTIVDRGSTADPTANEPGIWGNRYEQQGSTGNGTGASLIFWFRVHSLVTDSAGSGGAATGYVVFRPSQLVGCSFEGTWITYGRHGVQDAKDSYMQRCVLKSDPTRNKNGVGNPGGHWDGNDNFQFESIVVEDTQQGVAPDNSGGAALSIDTSTPFQNRRCKGGLIHIKSAAWHGLALNADLSCDRIRVDHAGKDAVRTAANQFGSPGINAGAKGFLHYRGNLWCPDVQIVENEEKCGAGFEYNYLCASTGVTQISTNQVAGDAFIDADTPAVEPRVIPSWIGKLTVLGVCRKGIGFVDPNNVDASQPVNIKIGSLFARLGPTIGLTSGYRMMHVNRSTAFLPQTIVDVDHAQFITEGAVRSATAPCVFTDQDTDVRFGKIDFPLHGAGTLIDANGRIRCYATANQVNNAGLPTSSGNPMFTITGTTGVTTADGSVVDIVCDCTTNHMQQPILRLTDTANCRLSIKARNYRNADLVSFAGTNSGLYFHDSEIIGLNGAEVGLSFGGSLSDCLFIGNRVANCSVGARQNGTPAFSNCNGLANRMYSNGTNSNLAPGSIADRGGSSTLST